MKEQTNVEKKSEWIQRKGKLRKYLDGVVDILKKRGLRNLKNKGNV